MRPRKALPTYLQDISSEEDKSILAENPVNQDSNSWKGEIDVQSGKSGKDASKFSDSAFNSLAKADSKIKVLKKYPTPDKGEDISSPEPSVEPPQ